MRKNSQIYHRLMSYGLSGKSAATALDALSATISSMLLDGQEVSLPLIGTFYFGYRKGRHSKGNNKAGPHFQKESYPVRFAISPAMKEKLRIVLPVNVRMSKKPSVFKIKEVK